MNLVGLLAVVFSSFTIGFVMRGLIKREEKKPNALDEWDSAPIISKRRPTDNDKRGPYTLWVCIKDNDSSYFISDVRGNYPNPVYKWVEFVPKIKTLSQSVDEYLIKKLEAN